MLSVPADLMTAFRASGEKLTQKKFIQDMEKHCGKRSRNGCAGVYSKDGVCYLKGWEWKGDAEEQQEDEYNPNEAGV